MQRRPRFGRARGERCTPSQSGSSLAIRAAFVNHGLRASAWQDECVVLQLAAQLEVPLDVVALRSRRSRRAAAADGALRRADRRREAARMQRRRDRASRRGSERNGAARVVARHRSGRACAACAAGADSPRPSISRVPSLESRRRRCARTATRGRCRTRSIRRTRRPACVAMPFARHSPRCVRSFRGSMRAVARAAEVVAEERDATARARASPVGARAARARGRAARHRLLARRGGGAGARRRPNRDLSYEAWDRSENRAGGRDRYYAGERRRNGDELALASWLGHRVPPATAHSARRVKRNGRSEIHGRLLCMQRYGGSRSSGASATRRSQATSSIMSRTIVFFQPIGYGLDYKELSCNLPHSAKLREGKTV